MLKRIVVLSRSIPLRRTAVAMLPVLLASIVVIALPTVVPIVGTMPLLLVLRLLSQSVRLCVCRRQRLFHWIPLRSVEGLLGTLLCVVLFPWVIGERLLAIAVSFLLVLLARHRRAVVRFTAGG